MIKKKQIRILYNLNILQNNLNLHNTNINRITTNKTLNFLHYPYILCSHSLPKTETLLPNEPFTLAMSCRGAIITAELSLDIGF